MEGFVKPKHSRFRWSTIEPGVLRLDSALDFSCEQVGPNIKKHADAIDEKADSTSNRLYRRRIPVDVRDLVPTKDGGLRQAEALQVSLEHNRTWSAEARLSPRFFVRTSRSKHQEARRRNRRKGRFHVKPSVSS